MEILATENWYLTKDGKRVRERHPLAATLLVAKGTMFDQQVFDKYPELEEDDVVTEELDRVEDDEQPGFKEMKRPPRTKAVKDPERTKRERRDD